MIEQDPIHSKEVIGFPEVDHYPVCIELSSTCVKKEIDKNKGETEGYCNSTFKEMLSIIQTHDDFQIMKYIYTLQF